MTELSELSAINFDVKNCDCSLSVQLFIVIKILPKNVNNTVRNVKQKGQMRENHKSANGYMVMQITSAVKNMTIHSLVCCISTL